MKRYKSADELPRLIHRILGTNYELLGFFQKVSNEELEKGHTQAEAFTEAWEWIKRVFNKP